MPYPAFPSTNGLQAASVGSQGTIDFMVDVAEFGEGHVQRVPQGMNHIREPFNYRSPPLTAAQAKIITDFIKLRGGSKPFTFLVPGETVQRQFICKKLTADFPHAKHQVLSGLFEPNFDP